MVGMEDQRQEESSDRGRWEAGDMNLGVTCEADKTTGIYRKQSTTTCLSYEHLQDYDKELEEEDTHNFANN